MQCCYRVLCPIFAALGIFVASMYVKDIPAASLANWLVVGYLLIGYAVGGIISGILSKCCGKSCGTGEGS